eukprot:NODE_12894_length_1197_cov_6.403738.p1 GENE.NODE_12894_length_1197_cov_6.403738~~NODE_12894_length_1197_cov_6.403738.p1  ORF type:complete len:305 (-),score=84.52 NODE_12894_length_1197_cov_6.403738:281-1075(-)
MNGMYHGTLLEALPLCPGCEIYRSRANTGKTRAGTFWCTLQGIEVGASRLFDELLPIIQRRRVQAVSLVGGSFGGLYCRAVAPRLAEVVPELQFRHFVTLATPHLGGIGESALAPWVSPFCASVRDLTYVNATLAELHTPAALAALSRFTSRTTYAPVLYDGIVHWCSAALSGGAPEAFDGLMLERVSGSYEPWPRGDGGPAALGATAALKALRSIEWTVVDVNLEHRPISALRPPRPGFDADTRPLAEDVLRRVEALRTMSRM